MSTKASAPNFGKALRALRLERDLSQEDFYEVSGRTYVSRLENNGADPSLSKVVQLAQVMGIRRKSRTMTHSNFSSRESFCDFMRVTLGSGASASPDAGAVSAGILLQPHALVQFAR